MTRHPVVLIAEELSPATVEALGADIDVRHVDGSDRAGLLPALSDADAVLVRSATRMDREAIAAAPRLKVIARAGVGLDNVDIPAATEAGVLVANAPASNVTSAAEFAVGLLLAAARNIPQADAALKNGSWQRGRWSGVELSGKVLGVVGLGRIGSLVARRMAAFGMDVVAYDPFVSAAHAAATGVRLLSLDEVLARCDFLTVHLPRTPETTGLIGFDALRKVKPTVRIVNAARGGIVDENELYAALKEGRVAGAALDVYASEPCTDSPLFALDNVVVTPHLGASTDEAQEKAGVAAARSVRLALAGGHVPDAVNVQGGPVPEALGPWLPLTERLGQVFTRAADGVPVQLEILPQGEIAGLPAGALELAALKGVLERTATSAVSHVNAPLVARERGLTSRLTTSQDGGTQRSAVTLRGIFPDGRVVTVTGTLAGVRLQEKLVEALGHELELPLSGDLSFLRYPDRPGSVGVIGGEFAAEGVNIAAMQVSRDASGATALAGFCVDTPVSATALGRAAAAVGADLAWRVPATDPDVISTGP
ncbi:phosphoglycerate dehydrogenase [Streptomyces sp. HC44]|uniref:D-3-phosphoglycerate dehydrogenase n=1 Tax=Streptomyces scabichelini TaxID=2711217 RepID=A0A6G4V0K4_9ACTN|nr:phosphoglycerate dehydrogenase [Streptomyces scabichelini]